LKRALTCKRYADNSVFVQYIKLEPDAIADCNDSRYIFCKNEQRKMRAISGMNALNFCPGASVFIIDCVISWWFSQHGMSALVQGLF